MKTASPQTRLKRLPALLEFDEEGKFSGVSIFKPTRQKSRTRAGRRAK